MSGDTPLAVAKYEAWLLDVPPTAPLHPTITPIGRPSVRLCDAAFLSALMTRLAGQDWLDRVLKSSMPDKSERVVGLLSAVGDLWRSQPAPRSPLPLRPALTDLLQLKIAISLLGAVRLKHWTAARRQLALLGSDVSEGLRRIEAVEPREHRAIEMTVALVIAHQLEAIWGHHLAEGEGAIPFRLPRRPRTPSEYAWASLAIGAGAVLPFQDIPAIHVCDYPPCSRIFARVPRSTRGERTFCSKPCGDRFWARKATQARRAAQRANRQQQQEP